MGSVTAGEGSSVDPATIQAYMETEFRVDGDIGAILRVGVHCAKLAALHKDHGTNCSAFITACNPRSAVLAEQANGERQAALALELRKRSLPFIGGTGKHPSNRSPCEPSFLVLGLDLEAAKKLGAQLEQNAIIWSGADAVPQLILLR
jgi:hypothetical protein